MYIVRTMDQSVRRRLITALARVRAQAIQIWTFGGQSSIKTSFSPSALFSLVSFLQCSALILSFKVIFNKSKNGSRVKSFQRKRYFFLLFCILWVSAYWFQSHFMRVHE